MIYDELLTVHEIDVTSLRPGAYTVQLIVYEFESGVSQSGTIVDTGERFDRTLEIAQIEL